MTLEELRADFAAQGQPAFHALQVYRWLHRGVRSFSEMSDQSKAFRQKLSERYYIAAAEIEQRLVSKLDGTAKGGIVIAISAGLGVPVKLVGVGEGIDDLIDFDRAAFLEAILPPAEGEEA